MKNHHLPPAVHNARWNQAVNSLKAEEEKIEILPPNLLRKRGKLDLRNVDSEAVTKALGDLQELRKPKSQPGAFGKKGTRRKPAYKLPKTRKGRPYQPGELVLDSRGREYIATARGALVAIFRIDGQAHPVRSSGWRRQMLAMEKATRRQQQLAAA